MIEDFPQKASIPFRTALLYWLKLGFISFGGPAGQISMMHQELVEKRRWISEHRFLHALNYTMVLPGPEAQQLATYIGWLMHGTKGGILAGVLFVLPSLFILIALTWAYLRFHDTAFLQGVLFGVKPAVTAIVVFAAYRIGSKALKNNPLRAIALAAFLAIFAFNMSFPFIIIAAGLIAYIGARFSASAFNKASKHSDSEKYYGVAIIDDNTPIPEHAKFNLKKTIIYALVGLSIWLGALSVLYANNDWGNHLSQMGEFFTKAALLTFGGAYAVLPYVYQGAVEQYGWLTGTQMIDGLALGETTPGPLIMVVAFVGFVGGWTKELFGGDMLFWAGMSGAVVATFFTFLPSFLFILIGGPAVEATRNNLKFTAPLAGITAAVVGVILNLALFFAYHVLWPNGLEGAFSWISLLIGFLAFIALWKNLLSVVKVILICAIAGLTYTFFV